MLHQVYGKFKSGLEKRSQTQRHSPAVLTAEQLEGRQLLTWLGPGSVATWTSSTHILDVTGHATIIADPGADPGADQPIIGGK